MSGIEPGRGDPTTPPPAVTVVTPTYQRATLLPRAIDSVLAQTRGDLEYVIVDDGSTDGTEALVRSYQDPRIRYERQENQGQSVARNRGVELARAPWVAFLDSDNAWFPDRLERHLEVLVQEPDVDVLYGVSVPRGRDPAEHVRRVGPRPSGRVTRELLLGNFVPLNSTTVRRARLLQVGGFDPQLRSAEDYDLWLRLSVAGRFVHAPIPSAIYGLSEGSVSTDLRRNFRANEWLLRRFLRAHPDLARSVGLGRIWARHHVDVAEQWIGVRRYGAAAGAAFRALGSRPASGVSWLTLGRILVNAIRRPAWGDG